MKSVGSAPGWRHPRLGGVCWGSPEQEPARSVCRKVASLLPRTLPTVVLGRSRWVVNETDSKEPSRKLCMNSVPKAGGVGAAADAVVAARARVGGWF